MQVALCLYVHFGSRVLLQLEVFLNLLVSKLTDAHSSQSSELQEAALEVCCPTQLCWRLLVHCAAFSSALLLVLQTLACSVSSSTLLT